MTNLPVANEDLTAKARIRNAALDLFAQHGEEAVSLRAIAVEAGVTPGLIQHHFKTKAALRDAVARLVTGYCWQAVNEAPTTGGVAEVARARTEAIRRMYKENPSVFNYIRRSAFDHHESPLVKMFIDNARAEVEVLREAGLASTQHRAATQTIAVLMRHMSELFLEPVLETAWRRLQHGADDAKPRLSVIVRDE